LTRLEYMFYKKFKYLVAFNKKRTDKASSYYENVLNSSFKREKGLSYVKIKRNKENEFFPITDVNR
jgi:hypothetical protein